MKRILRGVGRLLHPPRLVLLLLPPMVFAALVFVFIGGWSESAPAYAIYAMSAYCFTILVIRLPGLIRRGKKCMRQKLSHSAFGERYLNNPAFRGGVGVCWGMIADFLYAVFRVFLGIHYVSVWFITMAVYYFVLGAMRFFLIVGYCRRTKRREIVCYCKTAWGMLLLNATMGGMIALTVLTDAGYSYPGYIVYVSAFYTFCTVILAIVNIVKYRKLGSPVLSAAKALNLVASLMSLLGLQTALISQFAGKEENYRRAMNAITGGCIWLGVILIAVYMILRGNQLKSAET